MKRSLGVLFVGSLGAIGVFCAIDAPADAAADGCPRSSFVGTIERDDDTTNNQPATSVGGRDIRSTLAVDFGSPRNTTVYIADTKLDPDDVGTTIVAAPGGMVTTIFLRPKSGNLAPGKKLSTPRDQLSVVVDTGGGARASTSGVDASVKMLTFSGDRVCFSIDYRDDFQRVTGKVRAKLVAPRPN